MASLIACSPLLGLAACGGGGGGGGGGGQAAASNQAPPPPPPAAKPFANATAASNISYRVEFTTPSDSLVAESTFGGAASGDCDGDGDIDLFITYGDHGPNRLYLNQLSQGNPLAFQDTAATAGVDNTRPDGRNDRHSGPIFADMDGDGDLDLFVGGIYGDPNHIFENAGDCTFSKVTSGSPGIASMRAEHTISAAFGDYDLDGDLDLFLTHWGTQDSTYTSQIPPRSEHLWRNDSAPGDIRFVNVSAESGVTEILWETRDYPESTQDKDFTFTPTFARIDSDPWPDIVIAGDYGTTQTLINNRDLTFWNATDSDLRTAQWGMGSALGDIDFDGDLDWFVTSIFGPGQDGLTPWGNRLYLNEFDLSEDPDAWFTDITESRAVQDGQWGWGACFLDIDNDTDLDIYHTNGWQRPEIAGSDFRTDPSRLFEAEDNGTYHESAPSFGLDDTTDARGVVCADFDEDGDTDLLLLTNRSGNSAILWENRDAASGNNYLRVRLEGAPPNTAAAGARIFVLINGRQQMREIAVGNNYISQNPNVQVFGLGNASNIDELRVEWPAIVPAPGMAPETPIATVLSAADVAASISNGTLDVPHPDLSN